MRRANPNHIRFLFLHIRNISITTKITMAAINEDSKPVACLTVPAITDKIINTRSYKSTRTNFSIKDIVFFWASRVPFPNRMQFGSTRVHYFIFAIKRRRTAVIVAAFTNADCYSFCSFPTKHCNC